MATYKYDKTTGRLTKIAGGTLYADTPIGTIQAFGGSTFPSGWLLCNGAELNITDYPDLYAVIGTSFGTPSANTKFKLPDLRESTLKGVGLTSKSNNHYDADGLALGEFIDDRVQAHTHSIYTEFGATANPDFSPLVSNSYMQLAGTDAASRIVKSDIITGQTTRNGATTEVKAVGVNFIIKAKSVGLPADFANAVEEAIDTSDLAKTLPYSFNASSNISAFNRKFVNQGSSITWAATHTGRLTLRFLKAGDGYSLYLNKNGVLADSYDNFFGTDSQSSGCTQASITLVAWVEKGNTIVLESNLPSTTPVEQTFFCQTGLLAYNTNYD